MKRFFSLLTVFMLAFSLAVPASALTLNGSEFPDLLEDGYPMKDYILDEDFTAFVGTVEFNGSVSHYMYLLTSSVYLADSGNLYARDAGEQFIFVASDGVWKFDRAESFEEHGLVLSRASKYITWSRLPIYDSYGNLAFSGSGFGSEYCDGSTCPATDANADGICDDCGKVLMLSAPQQYTHTVIFRYADGTFVKSEFTSDTEFTPTGYLADDVYRVDNGKVVDQIMYESFDGLSWEQTRSNSVSNQVYNYEDGMTVYQSTFDWYDESGNRFFPVPLWEQVGMVTQGEMGNLTAETVGTLKVLVPFGVGLMACLVALSLFGKRSLISLR